MSEHSTEDAGFRYDIGGEMERTAILCDALDDIHELVTRMKTLENRLSFQADALDKLRAALNERETTEILRGRMTREERRAQGGGREALA